VSGGQIAWAIVKLLLACIPLALSLWALLDAAHRPEWAFALARRSRTLWVVLTGAGILVCGPGVVIALWYLLKVRPAVAAAEGGRLGGV
jgi:hypothetical protein